MEEEVGRLVVRLIGDGSEFQKMVDDAEKSISSTVPAIENLTNATNMAHQSFTALQSVLVQVGVAYRVFKAELSSVSSAVEFERNQIRLRAVLEGNNRNVEGLTARYREFAAQEARNSTISAGTTMRMLQRAEVMGITGTQAERVVHNAIALGAAMQQEPENFIRSALAMERGSYQLLRRQLQLQGVKNEEELRAKVLERIRNGEHAARAETESAGHQFELMSRSVAKLSRELGDLTLQWLKPASQFIKRMAEEFQKLDPTVKNVVYGITTLAGALAVLIPTWQIFTKLWAVFKIGGAISSVFTAVAGVLSGPMLVAIIAVAAAVAILVEEFGGWENLWNAVKGVAVSAWGAIKQAVSKFVDWVTPIMRSVWGTLEAGWNLVSETVRSVMRTIVVVVGSYLQEVYTFWTDVFAKIADFLGSQNITQTIIVTFITAEFILRNFGAFWRMTWTGMQLDAVTVFEVIIHFFRSTVPTTLSWFANNWQSIFRDVFNWTSTMLFDLSRNIVNVIRNIPALLTPGSGINWSDVWKPMGDAFIAETRRLELPQRVTTEMERRLRADFERQSRILGEGYATFLERRLREVNRGADNLYAPTPGAMVGGEQPHAGASSEFKAVGKVDAVLRNSAEATTRIADYADSQSKGGGGPRPSNPAGAVNMFAEQAQAANRNIIDVLRDIAANTRAALDGEEVVLNLANLDGGNA